MNASHRAFVARKIRKNALQQNTLVTLALLITAGTSVWSGLGAWNFLSEISLLSKIIQSGFCAFFGFLGGLSATKLAIKTSGIMVRLEKTEQRCKRLKNKLEEKTAKFCRSQRLVFIQHLKDAGLASADYTAKQSLQLKYYRIEIVRRGAYEMAKNETAKIAEGITVTDMERPRNTLDDILPDSSFPGTAAKQTTKSIISKAHPASATQIVKKILDMNATQDPKNAKTAIAQQLSLYDLFAHAKRIEETLGWQPVADNPDNKAEFVAMQQDCNNGLVIKMALAAERIY